VNIVEYCRIVILYGICLRSLYTVRLLNNDILNYHYLTGKSNYWNFINVKQN